MPLLSRDISAPVADLDISLQQFGVGQRLSELVAHADLLGGSCLALAIWTVRESGSLLLRILLAVCVQRGWHGDDIWDIDRRQLELRLLLECGVGAWSICGELVQDILLVVLLDLGGEGLEGGEDVVGDGEGELLFW